MVYGTHRDYRRQDGKDPGNAYKTFRDLDLVVEQSVRTLKPYSSEFDCIIVTGVSGLSVGAPVALKLKKKLLVLRKESDQSHDMAGRLLGDCDLADHPRVLFLDDLISSGATLRKCEEAVAGSAALYASPARVTHEYLYENDHLKTRA